MKTKKGSNKIHVITLGCSKNLVDSEYLMKQFGANNLEVVHDADKTDARVVLINTCGFINDAKQESIDTILEYVEAKKRGKIDHVFVMGCLSERYKEDLKNEIPEVDEYFGVNHFKQITERMGLSYKQELVGERMLTTPSHYAYLKISEGCNRSCAFCAIPIIKGRHISKPIDELVAETQVLASQGVKELILIAQDLSSYGIDTHKMDKLTELTARLSDIEGIEWIRLHYTYPTGFPKALIQLMKERPNICRYLDIPFQHFSDRMLKQMHRGHTKQQALDLIAYFRSEIPDIALRTTLLTGHPGETEADFNELLDMVQQVKFDRLGVFGYSHEEDTYSFKHYTDDIPDEIKQQRVDALMETQQLISAENNALKIGKSFKVLIDREESEYYVGRTQYDSPEVDNEVLIDKTAVVLQKGQFIEAEVTSASEFDLYARCK